MAALNAREHKVVLLDMTVDAGGHFRALEDGRRLDAEIKRYSRMKFGDVEAIDWWARKLADKVVAELAGGSLRGVFEECQRSGAHVYIMAPGVRNVISASNQLMRQTAFLVNAWLALRGLPTMICRPLTRLGSGRANYAELDAEARRGREKSTRSIIPRSEFEEHPIHVLFLDDVEVTGATANRARERCLAAGARSFHGIFAMRVVPEVAAADPGIEHRMNQFQVSGRLDEDLLQILNHPGYEPVQRMLRLLFHPANRVGVGSYFRRMKMDVLKKIYLAGLSNDYLKIESPSQTGQFIYADSLILLQNYLRDQDVLGESGLPL